MTVRMKSSARRGMLKLPDSIFIKAFRVILQIKDSPYPRGFKKAQGQKIGCACGSIVITGLFMKLILHLKLSISYMLGSKTKIRIVHSFML